jgi:hypothetical protein
MTSTRTQIQGSTEARGRRPVSQVLAYNAQAPQHRDLGRNRVRGLDPAEPPEPVRHLVIFRAPVL